MRIFNLAAGFLLTVGMAAQAHADTNVFGELGLAIDGFSAGGNGVNTSGFPFDEPGNFNALKAIGEVGAVYDTGFAWSLSANYSATDVGKFNSIGAPTNDGPAGASQAVMTLGYLQPDYFVGGFAGLGDARFIGSDNDQNATYRLVGVGGAFQASRWSHGLSLSLMDVIETDDPETLSDTVIVKVQSEFALGTDTQLGVFATYLEGEMDWDGALADPVNGGSFGVYVRHKLGQVGKNPLLLDAGVSRVMLNEAPPSADHSLWATNLHIGFSVVFGKGTPSLMRVASAPDMTTAQIFNPLLD
ncbi:hypothetical protein [Shimia sp. Alg240-R146]|uniref:hypothetical protein n=1 Tax=Shimia sp. Alg240-R146 TaxID=2993449 RepID=UPI0022E6CC1B|nr:hypothetical protein [Shimia sp. Alg240-R146]